MPQPGDRTKVAGMFAGIGGFEQGLADGGNFGPAVFSEIDPAAQQVLRHHFPDTPIIGDVHDVRSLPQGADIVTAGFPCTDISQAGRGAGIFGDQSGLVAEVFRTVRRRYPEWLVLENVQNLLVLSRGAGIRHITDELDSMKMRWAYRVVDSRFAGVPQRRRRVILVASRVHDPRTVLFADDAGERDDYSDDAYGFYWTEGLRGLGWAQDAVPTLKGGSTIGIPSPPAVWVPDAQPGRKLIMPSPDDMDELQGFVRGWTAAFDGPRSTGKRMKMTGNAVTVGVARWLGERLRQPGEPIADENAVEDFDRWPRAAWGEQGRRYEVEVSEYPRHDPYRHLLDVLDVERALPVSHRGAKGFLSRTRRAKLRFDPAFIADVEEHVELTDPDADLAASA